MAQHPGASTSSQRLQANTVLVHDLANVLAEIDDEAHLELFDALANDVLSLVQRHVRLPIAIHQTEGEHRTISMRAFVDLLHAAHVIQEVKAGAVGVNAGDKHVHLVGTLAAERLSQRVPREVRGCPRGKLEAGPERVQADVLLDHLDEVGSVRRRPGSCDKLALDFPNLVIVVLQLHHRERRLGIRGDDHEILPLQAEHRLGTHGDEDEGPRACEATRCVSYVELGVAQCPPLA
mmetsp:Transcript_60549/g.173653  ORF Transcript_60549/g.173653 Transcript_60549/m.173653 type:complete len:235 (-) Transcript_60549:3-707(-)